MRTKIGILMNPDGLVTYHTFKAMQWRYQGEGVYQTVKDMQWRIERHTLVDKNTGGKK